MSGNNIQSLGAGGLYGTNTTVGGGGSRDALDAQRMGVGRIPSAEWPDGYLGTIRSRRDDRLLDAVKDNLNRRSYQRGVHVGSRIDPGDYTWPTNMRPDRGLKAEARGQRAQLVNRAEDVHLVNGGTGRPMPPGAVQIDPARAGQLAFLTPRWK